MATAKNIDELQLLENYLLALNFPTKGIIPMRVLSKEQVTWDPYVVNYSSTTTEFPADGWKDPAKIGHPTDRSVSNILEVSNAAHIYQLFYGIKQQSTRAYLSYPTGVARRNIDIKSVSARCDFGFVDGSMSPYDNPQPCSEMWIPRGIDVGFAWHNRSSRAETITVKWIMNIYAVELIEDLELIDKILKRKTECRIATMGGNDAVAYDTEAVWGVSPIPLDATRDDVMTAMRCSV